VVSQAKLIAEPWDVGEGGYQVGKFPPLWTEWNGKYRDTVRDFWRGYPQARPDFASRLTGSSDLYETSARRPVASINFVTAHDGFTLADLVSYNRKHNKANGEDNRDGTDDNRSWNCGAEGPAGDPRITGLRERQQRNFLVTLLCSQGVPMLLAGDEFGRTQAGNNNAYCQDSEISWIDWAAAGRNADLLKFACELIALRREHPIFRRRRFFSGSGDITWLTPAGEPMTETDWRADGSCLAVALNGEAITEPDDRGQQITDDNFLLLFNAGEQPQTFQPTSPGPAAEWEVIIDTADPAAKPGARHSARTPLPVTGRSVVVLQSRGE
jgi:glycogen operon protein